MKLGADGQITIPEHIRRQAGLSADCEVEIRFENGRLWLEKLDAETHSRRQRIFAAMQQAEGSATANLDLNTDEIMRITRGE